MWVKFVQVKEKVDLDSGSTACRLYVKCGSRLDEVCVEINSNVDALLFTSWSSVGPRSLGVLLVLVEH